MLATSLRRRSIGLRKSLAQLLFVVRSGSAMRIGANSLVFLQPTTRAYTARTSTGLSRLTEPMTSRRVPITVGCCSGFYPGGILHHPSKNDRGFIRERHSARGHYLCPSGQLLFGRSVSRTRLASKVIQSFTSKGGPQNGKFIVCTARQGRKI